MLRYGQEIVSYEFLNRSGGINMEISDGISVELYSTENARNNILEKVSTKMLAKTLDQQEVQGAQLTKMMEQSVNPNLGANIDIRV
jgi:hypothetical protein